MPTFKMKAGNLYEIIYWLFLLLFFFLLRLSGRFLFRFAFRVDDTLYRFADRQFIQYTETWGYCFHQ